MNIKICRSFAAGVERVFRLLVEYDEDHTVELLAGRFGDFVIDEAQAAISAYVGQRPLNKVISAPIRLCDSAADRRWRR